MCLIGTKYYGKGLPWWYPVVNDPPRNARDTGSIPGPGKTPRAARQLTHRSQLLSLSSGAWEPRRRSPRTREPAHTGAEPLPREARAGTRERPPRRNRRKKTRTARKSSTAKNNKSVILSKVLCEKQGRSSLFRAFCQDINHHFV